MSACEWLWFDVTWSAIGILAIVCIWGQRRAANRAREDLRTRFFKEEL